MSSVLNRAHFFKGLSHSTGIFVRTVKRFSVQLSIWTVFLDIYDCEVFLDSVRCGYKME